MQAPLAVLRNWLASIQADRLRSAQDDGVATHGEIAGVDALQVGLEMALQGILVMDADWKIVALNSPARALLPVADSDLPGRDIWGVVPARVAENHRSVCEQALQGGKSHAFVVQLSRENQWVEFSLRPHPDGVVVNLRDVSETRQTLQWLHGSEACNQSLFDGNTQAMWLFDAETRRVLAVNKAAKIFYGLPDALAVMPRVEAFFHEGEAAPWLARLSASQYQQQMQICTQRRKSGELVLVELACSTVQWFGRPAVLVSVVDVGARHFADVNLQRLNEGLEEQLAQCRAELQLSRQELDTFTHALSDDLKAPLHVVSGFASTLTERYAAVLDEQGRHYLARIRASTRQLAKLFDDLRTLAHLPGVTLNSSPVDLAPVCRRLVAEWKKREPTRQLVLEIPPVLPVYGDRDLLVTALNCLMENARKFTGTRPEGWIKVALMPGTTPGASVLVVADNGVGFNEAYADKLFTAFQRLHSSADFPGGGLGLAIVKRVAERHGGAAWATTTAQGGASFFLSLPHAPQEEPAVHVSVPERLGQLD